MVGLVSQYLGVELLANDGGTVKQLKPFGHYFIDKSLMDNNFWVAFNFSSFNF